jgi:two-component system, cell cycle response regulator
MRITKKVFSDLAIFMISFGVIMGIVFPFFVYAMGIPGEMVLKPSFFIYCILAGITVGFINIILARSIVGKKLILIAHRMRAIEADLASNKYSANTDNIADYLIDDDSEDEIGEASDAYNNLVRSLSKSLYIENTVKSFNEMLSSTLELEALSRQALHQLIIHMSANGGAIFVEKSGELVLVSSESIRDPEPIADSDIVWRALKTNQRQHVYLPEDIRVEGVLTDFFPREILVEPILYKDLPIGVIILVSVKDFNKDDQHSFDVLSSGLALALRNAIMYDQIHTLAARDPLTGLYNRRFGMTRLNEEFARSTRNDSPLGLIIFDIDHFKRVNDTHGHLIGDRVLVNIAKTARTVIREGDILMRYGGEEFVIILPGASVKDTYNLAERLRHIVEDTSINQGSQTIKVTISIGVSSHPECDANDANTLIKNADDALYTAKDSGRNCIVVK